MGGFNSMVFYGTDRASCTVQKKTDRPFFYYGRGIAHTENRYSFLRKSLLERTVGIIRHGSQRRPDQMPFQKQRPIIL
jgi:hypothetical protein